MTHTKTQRAGSPRIVESDGFKVCFVGQRAPFFHTSKIWSICSKYGTKNTDWAKLSHDGKIDFGQAAQLVKAWQERDAESFEQGVQKFIPDFKLHSTPWGKLPDEGQPSPQEQPQGMPQGTKPQAPAEGPKYKVYEVKTEGYFKPENFDEICALIEAKVQVVLVGPSGLGKSRLIREAGKAIGGQLSKVSVFAFGGGIRPAHVFYTQEIKDGTSRWILQPFLQALQEPGIVCIDEIMGADEDVLLGLNTLMELSQRYIQTPLGQINVHPDCVICATSNTTGREISDVYTGTKKQDMSVLNRLVQIPCDYSSQVEAAIMKGQKHGDHILRRLEVLRRKARESQISQDFSTRGLFQIKALLAAGATPKRAFYLVYIAPLSLSEKANMGVDGDEERGL